MDTRKQQTQHRFDLTWPQILGLALLFAGVSESLRNLGRLVAGDGSPVSLLFCLAFAAAGVWILRKPQKEREQ